MVGCLGSRPGFRITARSRASSYVYFSPVCTSYVVKLYQCNCRSLPETCFQQRNHSITTVFCANKPCSCRSIAAWMASSPCRPLAALASAYGTLLTGNFGRCLRLVMRVSRATLWPSLTTATRLVLVLVLLRVFIPEAWNASRHQGNWNRG